MDNKDKNLNDEFPSIYSDLNSSIEDFTNIENATLGYSVPNKSSRKQRPIDKLFTYLNNINLESQHQFNKLYIKSNLVKFSKYLVKKNSKRRYIYTVLLALVVSIVTIFMTQNSGLYSAGFSGVFQGIARLVQAVLARNNLPPEEINIVYNVMFWGLYFLGNIPLIIFAYKKISKEFAYLTIIYIFFNQAFGFMFSQIPNIHDIMIFGNTTTQIDYGGISIKLTSWNGFEPFLLFIYAIVSGLLYSIPYILLYIFNSSTGGSDIVSIYFAKRKNKSIGTILVIVNVLCIFIGTLLGSFGAQAIVKWDDIITSTNGNTNQVSSVFQAILSPNLVFSMLMVIVTGTIVNFYFPRNKFVQIKIFTSNVVGLKEKLVNIGYKHEIYFNNYINAMDNSSVSILETVCMYVELPSLLSSIRTIDKTSMITINRLSDLDGEVMMLK